MKLMIDKALAVYTLKTGSVMTKTQLAQKLFPDSNRKAATVNLQKYVTGKAKRVELPIVFKICEICQVDPNFLVGWKDYGKHDPEEDLP